jgi:HEPN domain-containing protein
VKIIEVKMNNNSDNTNFNEFLEIQLPVFDEIFAKQMMPISQRPLLAALYFVNCCILEMKGESKKDFFNKEWFKVTYKLILMWYEKRYPEISSVITHQKLNGIVLIFNHPFQIKIPTSIPQEFDGEDKRWFCLPNSVFDTESVTDWIDKKPNLDDLSKEEYLSLIVKITKIATFSREIYVNLMTASLNHKLREYSMSIPSHIDKAIDDILSLSKNGINSSFWEIHLALEKTLKLVILQNGEKNEYKHDLRALCEIINNIKDLSIDCNLFQQFPSDKEAIKQRYCEGRNFTIQDAIKNYLGAIEAISKVTQILKRKIVFDNVKFLLKFPPWESKER